MTTEGPLRRRWRFDLSVAADELPDVGQAIHEAMVALQLHLARPVAELEQLDGLRLTDRGVTLAMSVSLICDADAPTVQEQLLERHAAAGGALSPARRRQLAEVERTRQRDAEQLEREQLLDRVGLGIHH